MQWLPEHLVQCHSTTMGRLMVSCSTLLYFRSSRSAPLHCLGNRYHKNVGDLYPGGDKEGRQISTLLRQLRVEKGVHVRLCLPAWRVGSRPD